jgi:hypothetical protein
MEKSVAAERFRRRLETRFGRKKRRVGRDAAFRVSFNA